MNTDVRGDLGRQLGELRRTLSRDGWDRLHGLRLLNRLKRVEPELDPGATADACGALISLLAKTRDEPAIGVVRLRALLDLIDRMIAALARAPSGPPLKGGVAATAAAPLEITVLAVGRFDVEPETLRPVLAKSGAVLDACGGLDGLPSPAGRMQVVLTDMDWLLALPPARLRALADVAAGAAGWIALAGAQAGAEARIELLRAGVGSFLPKPLAPQRLVSLLHELRADATGERHRVLLIDDRAEALESYAALFSGAGMDVRTQAEPLSALARIAEFDPDVLVVSDDMQDCRGPELVALVREHERWAHLPVICLATWKAREGAAWPRRAANEECLARNGDPAQLVAAVSAHARRYRRLRQMVAEIEARDADLQRALAVAQVGGWTLDAEGREMYWSPEALRILGLPADANLSLEQYLATVVHREDRAAVRRLRRIAFDGGRAAVEHRVVVDGEVRWLLSRAERVADAGDRILRYVGTVQDITERRRAELGREHATSALAQIVDGTPVPTFVIDAEHRITQWNRACERVLKIPAADMIGRCDAWRAFYETPRPVMADLIVDDVDGAMETYYGDSLRASLLVRGAYEAEGYFPNTGRWFSFLAAPLRDEAGRIVGAIETLQDITERKQAENDLRASRTLMASVLASASYAIIATDPEGIITVFNKGAENLLGYAAADLVGMCTPGAFHDAGEVAARAAELTRELGVEVAPGFDAFVARTRLTGEPDEREWTYIRKGGRRVPVLLSVTAIRTADGEVTGYLGVANSIEERKRAEANLRVAAIAFEAQEGMMITDPQGVIVRVNQAFTRLTGYGAEEAIGRTPALFKSGRHDDAFYARMWETLKLTGHWQGEIWNRRKNGKIYAEMLTVSSVVAPDGQVCNYIGTFSDISRNSEAEAEIHRLAFYDPLTHLPNRRLLIDRLQQAMSAGARSGRHGALLFIDLDNFKILNDTLGHDKGDLLLQQVAQRLAAVVREGDTVARLGGDEFVVMLEGLETEGEEAAPQARTVGEKIVAVLNQTYLLGDHLHHSTPSIGITLFAGSGHTVEDLLKRADFAMYQAKAAGRNTLRFFDPAMQAAVTARADLEAQLRRGLREGQFLLHYQVQVDGAGRPIGVEALVRWKHPLRGMVPPGEFIPLAEDVGLILPLGQWVLQTACEQLVVWARQPRMAALSVAVNVSARQFHHADFVDQVLATLDATGADPRRLKLELTESLLLDDVEDVVAKMEALKARGVGFSLDDFGTGYSSLTYLKRLPLDQLKIDQSFVRDVLTDPNDAAIARAIVTLGQSLGLAVIAEGVETEGQRDFLAASGCAAFQGYLFGRPRPAAEYDPDVAAATPVA